jgi:uncharacterized protein (DUF488 family)
VETPDTYLLLYTVNKTMFQIIPKRCHRALIADHLKAQGYTVMHIVAETKHEAHAFTSPARLVEGRLTYKEP